MMKNLEGLEVSLAILLGAILLGLLGYLLLFSILKHLSRKTESVLDESIVKHLQRPSLLIILLLVVSLSLPVIGLGPSIGGVTSHLISILWVISVAWLLIQIPNVVNDFILSQYKIDTSDNLEARKIHTQFRIFRKVVIFSVGILALGAILMTFDKVRQLGTSILASAGVIGLIMGFAAQRIFANMLAGIQLAITQPIRIDDVVIVENEWGWIEDITFTYVVVKIWDLRRLVLPISYFIERPFENWTRQSADILGAVFIYTDYTIPVQAVREELQRILEASKLWDGKVCSLQVIDSLEHTLKLRALMSAHNSPTAWSLRCEVREKLIEFIQKNYPYALPRMRAEIPDRNASTSLGLDR